MTSSQERDIKALIIAKELGVDLALSKKGIRKELAHRGLYWFPGLRTWKPLGDDDGRAGGPRVATRDDDGRKQNKPRSDIGAGRMVTEIQLSREDALTLRTLLLARCGKADKATVTAFVSGYIRQEWQAYDEMIQETAEKFDEVDV